MTTPSRRNIEVICIIGVATLMTMLAFHHDWQYDHAPDVDPGPFSIGLKQHWPIFVFYVGIFSAILSVFYLLLCEILSFLAFLWRKFIAL